MRWRARPSRGAECGHRAASSLSGGDSGRRKANTAPRATQDQACLRRGVEERPPCSRPRRAAPCQAGDPLRRSACPLHRRDLPHRLARFCAHGGVQMHSPSTIHSSSQPTSEEVSATTPSEPFPTATRSSVSLWTRTSATSRTRRRLPSSRRSSTITPRACLCRKPTGSR